MLNVLNLKHFLRANFPTPLGIDSQGCQNSLDFFNFFFMGCMRKFCTEKCTLWRNQYQRKLAFFLQAWTIIIVSCPWNMWRSNFCIHHSRYQKKISWNDERKPMFSLIMTSYWWSNTIHKNESSLPLICWLQKKKFI